MQEVPPSKSFNSFFFKKKAQISTALSAVTPDPPRATTLTPAARSDLRSSAAGQDLLQGCVCLCVMRLCLCVCAGGGLSNVDDVVPFLRWSELEVLCFPRRMRILLCLWWDDGNRIEGERKTNNGKINRELNLKPQERGFEPKHSGTQYGHIYSTTEWAAGRTKGVSDSNAHV